MSSCKNRKAISPLNKDAAAKANIESPYCRNYTERKLWMDAYIEAGGAWKCTDPNPTEEIKESTNDNSGQVPTKSDKKKQTISREPVKECDKELDRYIHVFVLVPGTTAPVNDLFKFITKQDELTATGNYWPSGYSEFLPSVQSVVDEVEKRNASDPEFVKCVYVKDFSWSGENNSTERKKAGIALLESLSGNGEIKAFWSKEVYFHFIGHSHGGNVINHALSQLAGSKDGLFGNKWTIKSVVYLSTPFFQKIAQPKSAKVHQNATIFNIQNYYDLTQLAIADFTVKQANHEYYPELSDIAERIINESQCIKTILLVKDQAKACVETKYELYVAVVKNLVPFVDRSERIKELEKQFEEAKKKLISNVEVTSKSLAKMLKPTIELFETFEKMIDPSSGAPNKRTQTLRSIIGESIPRLKALKKLATLINSNASNDELIKLVINLLSLVKGLLKAFADIVDNDQVFEIISVAGVNILQFFDDTLQTNRHYSELSPFSKFDEEVKKRDRFKNESAYSGFRAPLEKYEEALHNEFKLATSVGAFSRTKWLDWSTKSVHFHNIFRLFLAQLSRKVAPVKKRLKLTKIVCKCFYPITYSYYSYQKLVKGLKIIYEYFKPDVENTENKEVEVKHLTEDIENYCNILIQFIGGLETLDCKMPSMDNLFNKEGPGSLPYFAIVSHSVSREYFSNGAKQAIVNNATRG